MVATITKIRVLCIFARTALQCLLEVERAGGADDERDRPAAGDGNQLFAVGGNKED
jgi:hypothetical protein